MTPHLLLIDFETFYDDEYSLSKMPTAQYIRDARFLPLGAAVQLDDAEPRYLPDAELRPYLETIDWTQTTAVAHNAGFDAWVLRHYGHAPAYWLDTQLLSRWAISQGHLPPTARVRLAWWGERFGRLKGDTAAAVAAGGQHLADYALDDLLNMRDALRELLSFRPPRVELDLMDLHVRMATEPALALDRALLEQDAAQAPDPMAVQLRKNAPFKAFLRARGVQPGTKISPRTGKPTDAFAKTDAFMRSLARHPDPVVRKLHELRTAGGSNIVRTRAQRLLDVGDPLPVPLLYYGAHTGRSSGLDSYNLQNLPRQGNLRRAIMAPPGHKLVVIDLAQIEVRVLAWLAGEQWLLDAFRRGEDVYRIFAGKHLYGCDPDAVTPEQRQVGKAAVLALGFRQGANGFLTHCRKYNIPMGAAEAPRVVQVYRAAHPHIYSYAEVCMRDVQQTGKQLLPNGRLLTYPDLQYVIDEQSGRQALGFERPVIFSKRKKHARDLVKLWPGIAVENRVQAVARDVVMEQTLWLSREWKVVMSVHDEAVLCVPEDQAEAAAARAEEAFGTPPAWAFNLPTKGEAKIADRYGDAK